MDSEMSENIKESISYSEKISLTERMRKLSNEGLTAVKY
jgi:hypothetical protein